MKTIILSSTPRIDGTISINPANGYKRQLLLNSHKKMSCTFVTASPDNFAKTDEKLSIYRESLELIGITFKHFRCLDRRTQQQASQFVGDSDMLIFGGGHAPTQNKFFKELALKDLIKDFCGLILGTSAGSINSQSDVYLIPEEPGEAIDPHFVRFAPGLGLVDIQMMPHMNTMRHGMLDGLRIYEEIIFPDSKGRRIYTIPDGSYYFQQGNTRRFYGETWLVEDGSMRQLCGNGEFVDL